VWSVVHDPINLEFFFGIAAACVAERISRRAASAVLAVGAVGIALDAVLTVRLHLNVDHVGRLGYGLAAALALTGLVALERRGHLAAPRWLVRLGDATFTIYLFHSMVLSVLLKLAVKGGPALGVPSVVLPLLLAVAAVAVSLPAHALIERPLLRRLRSTPRRQAPGAIGTEIPLPVKEAVSA
jgi:peptidoglycan/LPS O-acetylase OafA/YrhL